MKKETASPPILNITQQKSFNEFKKEFNEQRPYEGIQFNKPVWLYILNSPRQFPTKIPKVEYDNSFEKPEKLKLMEL
ncbi:TPA: hypothetical protein I8027_000561 [Legionella pneumophila]|uniref:hypothetical protein n=1 Tax=Legionella pneumophila TaxID=446 RepID=UPI001375002E|nr:hypothetical protein [Legionella pneumophila]HAT2138164.1 hypothetical protein [Legionella pneumophila]HAT2148798.1 hypothetical protein [Legionella pneumophila]HAT2151995.1 hypothetical protein [Legionella pneumophila]HAT8728712.1 hypothetical protein [Legionella pneumophila]HCC0306662.1 hypothetical protein [Legionella pneumophila]